MSDLDANSLGVILKNTLSSEATVRKQGTILIIDLYVHVQVLLSLDSGA